MTSDAPREVGDLFDAGPAVTEAELRHLRDRLADRADAQGLLDVAYRTLDTPVGTLLAATGTGLVRVAYPAEGHDQVLATLAARVSPRILHAPRRLDAAATACATNPLPVVVPCHRVVRSDGSVGGYVGGPAAKRALLRLEAA
jgi:O-6-methylguanine DNA methyltransferase